ncbi:dixin-A isoform X2 [Clupea harengus]|uniref:Dixin-A isoform X2 n=1 Tax=Clupea harengus TaxID=7950 RepID=A0A6P8GX31_CLUHA|nr:dixin-A isoform X2 [Clupea harengus]
MGAKQMKCLSASSPTHAPKEEYIIARSEEQEAATVQPSAESDITKENLEACRTPGPLPAAEHAGTVEDCSWEDQLFAQQEQLEKEMQETRRMVTRLQALLLHGSLPEDEQGVALGFGETCTNAEQQMILIRSRLDQSMEETLDLKRELMRCKQEARNLQAVKDALQQRMSAQEDSVLQLKQELLRSSMARDELAGQNVELQRKLGDRSRILTEYKKELGQKDKLLQLQQHKLDESLRKANASNRLSGCENNGYSHMMEGPPPPYPHRTADELQLVRDALRSLRNSFGGHDPQHHTLDTLEQGISSLMERLHTHDTGQDRKGLTKSPGRRANHTDRESWPPSSKVAHSHSSPVLSVSVSTKVLYFTDRSLTPFLINIPKRLGDVTLRDFKAAVDRHGNFRYHFKALDPEFGTVKEEVFQDDAVIPGWEGKIVAWIEEDHTDSRLN